MFCSFSCHSSHHFSSIFKSHPTFYLAMTSIVLVKRSLYLGSNAASSAQWRPPISVSPTRRFITAQLPSLHVWCSPHRRLTRQERVCNRQMPFTHLRRGITEGLWILDKPKKQILLHLRIYMLNIWSVCHMILVPFQQHKSVSLVFPPVLLSTVYSRIIFELLISKVSQCKCSISSSQLCFSDVIACSTSFRKKGKLQSD